MAKRTKRDPLAPLLKLLRPYVRPDDLKLDHKVFLSVVVKRIKDDTQAYSRLRKNITMHSRMRRDAPV